MLMALFEFGEIAEQLADADVGGLRGGLGVEALSLELHGLRFLADDVERQIAGEPDRPPTNEALHVVAPDRRQVGSEPLLIDLQQQMTMTLLLLGHFAEDLGGIRITLGEIFREAEIDAAILFLAGNGDREHLALGQFGKRFHQKYSPYIFRIILNM